MFQIERYTADRENEWNAFVAQSKNGTFLADRRYMDYHADRFRDHSLMIRREGKLYALLPANVEGDTFYSHQGLTYGGLITDQQATAAHTTEVFRAINNYLKANAIHRVHYKAIPWIYHCVPAEEDLYAIHCVCDYRIAKRDISSVIIFPPSVKWKELRRRGVKRALSAGITVKESDDFETFWTILSANLEARFGVHPVHSLKEITLLKSRFPDNIRLFAAFKDGTMLGGTVVYVTTQTVHAQYISASPLGKQLGAIDTMFRHVLTAFETYRYFDFGKSTEADCRVLNEGLIHQKEGFGARGVCYDTYEWTI